MQVPRINKYNAGYNNKLLKPARQNIQSLLESLKKTKENLLKNPNDKFLQNILEDELDLLAIYNRTHFK